MKSKDMSYYMKSAIGLLFMFGFGLLPPIEPLTSLGMQIAGIFIGLIFLLCLVDIVWPSMLGLIALGMTEYCSVEEAISSGFGSELVWMMLIILVLAEAINMSGLGEVIARWLITRRFLNKRPVLFTLVYIIGLGLCSLLVSSTAAVIMGWVIFYDIADMVGYKKGDRYSTLMILGTFMSCIMYEGLFAFQSWWLVLGETFRDMTGYGINYVTYFILGFIIETLINILFVLSMKYVFKCDFDKLNEVDIKKLEGEGELKLNFLHKFFLLCFGMIVAYVFVTIICPPQWPFIALLNRITQSGWFAIVLCLAMIVRWKEEPALDFSKTASTGLSWNILMMCAAIIPVARALTSDATGMKEMLNNLLSPIFSGMNPVVFIITLIVMMMILTNVGSNMATGVVLMTVIIPFVGDYYFSPALIGMIIIFVATMGFILPGSSGMAPYLYGNDWIQVRDIYRYGLFYCLLFLICSVPVYLAASFII
jgi:Di- and tricarboxylate transporters